MTDSIFDGIAIPSWILSAIVAVIFLGIIIYSAFQARQIGVLQGKVSTNVDPLLRIFAYAYLLVQILIFVVAFVIL
jgi:hypothetical protein